MRPRTLAVTTAFALLAAGAAAAQTPVTTGVVIRGLTLPVPVPAPTPGTPVTPGRTCDFSREDVTQTGHMTDASVQCRAGGNVANTIPGMAGNFTAYCVMNAANLGGARLITADVPGNPNHCSLSAMKPADATNRFGGAKWR